MTTRTIKRHSTPTPVAALLPQILKHCPSADYSLVVWTVLSAPLPTKVVASEQIPTRLTERASTASAAVSTPVGFPLQYGTEIVVDAIGIQCNGILAGSLSFSSLVDQYQQISRLRLLNHLIGVLLRPDGLRSIVIHSSSSMTTAPSLIPPSGMFGFHR